MYTLEVDLPKLSEREPLPLLLICGSIKCALAMKIGGEAKAHEISKTHKWNSTQLERY